MHFATALHMGGLKLKENTRKLSQFKITFLR